MDIELDNAKSSAKEGDANLCMPVSGPGNLSLLTVTRVTPAAQRVSPRGLRNALRRRGAIGMGVLAMSFASAWALASFVYLPLAVEALLCSFLLFAPIWLLQRHVPQRCPACDTLLESVSQAPVREQVAETVTTCCPACDIEV